MDFKITSAAYAELYIDVELPHNGHPQPSMEEENEEMKKEITSLIANHTRNFEAIPDGFRPILVKCICKIQRYSNASNT